MPEDKPDYIGHRQRLKQRFLLGEGKDMADYELLELLLTYALPRRDVKPLAKTLINTFGSFAEVISASETNLKKINGIKDSSVLIFKLIKIAAQRLCWQTLASTDTPILFNTDHLIDYCRATMAYSEVEELRIIYMNSKFEIIENEIFLRGTVDSVGISPREIVRSALNKNAVGIVLVHNHPSGSVRPSENDIKVTTAIEEACNSVGVKLHDHIIISKSGYFSFAEHNFFS